MNRLIPLAVAACLAGCGGGGSSNEPVAPEAPVTPAPPALPQNLQSAPLPTLVLSPTLSVTLHAANGDTLTVSITPTTGNQGEAPQFGGAAESQVTETLSSTGGTLTAWFFYDEDPYTPIGFAYPAGLTCFYTGWTPPANLTVGESGQLDSISCDNGTTEVQTYEVTAHSPTEVQATLATEASNGNNITEVLLVNAAGSEQLVSMTIDGVTFTP